jgi:hypothetical protein
VAQIEKDYFILLGRGGGVEKKQRKTKITTTKVKKRR